VNVILTLFQKWGCDRGRASKPPLEPCTRTEASQRVINSQQRVVVMVVLNATAIVALPIGYQERGKKRREGEGKDKKIKSKYNKRGPPCDQTKCLPLIFLKFFVVFPTTFKLQGLGPIWVQLPKELYTKNMYKNHIFVRPRFANEQCLHLKQNSYINNL